MERVKATILERAIPDNVQPKILFTIRYISNLLLALSLNRLSPYKLSTGLLSQLNHLKYQDLPFMFLFIKKKKKPNLLNSSLELSKNY